MVESTSLLKMKVVYLSDTTDFNELEVGTVEAKNQNKYGIMHNFKDKMELVTNKHISDYHVYTSTDNKDKVFLCVTSPQLNSALHAIREKLTNERNYVFSPEKDVCYIKMKPEQAAQIPTGQLLNISVEVYGVFYQTSTKLSFLQMELTGFKSYPRAHFE